MPQNPQNTISQTELKHYKQFIIFRTEALRLSIITTDTGREIKVETEAKQIYQKILDFITNEIVKVEQEIINLPMDIIINISFNKHYMSW